MAIISISFSLFLLMDSIGNIPFYITFLKGLDRERQRKIIFRELMIALGIIIAFALIGDSLMSVLDIKLDTIQIAGGIILFLLCLKMIFPPEKSPNETNPPVQEEPFIVPLAVPLVAGPGVLAAVMIYAHQEGNIFIILGAILIAWFASLLILLTSPSLKDLLGSKGIRAVERLMGLVLALIAIQMFLSGVASFVKNIQ